MLFKTAKQNIVELWWHSHVISTFGKLSPSPFLLPSSLHPLLLVYDGFIDRKAVLWQIHTLIIISQGFLGVYVWSRSSWSILIQQEPQMILIDYLHSTVNYSPPVVH